MFSSHRGAADSNQTRPAEQYNLSTDLIYQYHQHYKAGIGFTDIFDRYI